jgi:hypothetical protein
MNFVISFQKIINTIQSLFIDLRKNKFYFYKIIGFDEKNSLTSLKLSKLWF